MSAAADDHDADEWSVEASPADTSAVLMSALRLSPDDPPETRRRAALATLESTGFLPDGNQMVAVLEACGVEDDTELTRARSAVSVSRAVDVGRDFAVDFFALPSEERSRRRGAIETVVSDSRMLTGHYTGLSKLVDVPPPPKSARDAELHALGTLVCLDPDASRKTAASLAVQAAKAGDVEAISPKQWPRGNAVFERNGGPPLWLVPPAAVGRSGKWSAKVVSRDVAAVSPEQPKKRWGLVVWSLFVVGTLLRSCASGEENRSTSHLDRESLRELARNIQVIERSADMTQVLESLKSLKAARTTVKPVLPSDAVIRSSLESQGYSVVWIASLSDSSAAVLGCLERAADERLALDGLDRSGPTDTVASDSQRFWIRGESLPDGFIAPGVSSDEAAELRRYLDELREDPSEPRTAIAEHWFELITHMGLGTRILPPWRRTRGFDRPQPTRVSDDG